MVTPSVSEGHLATPSLAYTSGYHAAESGAVQLAKTIPAKARDYLQWPTNRAAIPRRSKEIRDQVLGPKELHETVEHHREVRR